jgi:subfamily B ATP-binding cassette protein MsbA
MSQPPSPQPLHRRARAQIQRLWPYFGHARGAWVLAVVSTALASATEPMIPALLQPLLDRGFQGDGRLSLWQVPALLLLVFGLRAGASFFSQYGLARVINVGVQRMRDALFDKLLRAHLSLFSEQNASALANTVVYEVQNGAHLLINALVRFVRDVLTLVALAAYLLYLNWRLALVVAIILPPLIAVVRSLSKRMYRLSVQSQTATDELAYVVEENVLAHKDIRLHAAEAGQTQRFQQVSKTLRHLTLKTILANGAMSLATQMLGALALSAVITVAVIQSNAGATTVGGFVAFITAMLLLIAPMKSLADVANPLARSLTAMERGLDLMDQVREEHGGSHSTVRARGELTLQGVGLRYPSHATPALDGIDLHIRPGETVALVGSSGSGKTTLVNLLPRFLDCTQGSVALDGVEVGQWRLSSLRAQFAYVSQHVVMLNDTLAANVALGQTPDRERVRSALEAANLGRLVDGLPQGMDTLVGHNAMDLSGGERQRLAIARAIYKDASVLILDEATSALDSESEASVQSALERLMKNRTSIVIAHRLSTIRNADRIIVLKQGRAVEVGTHHSLLKRNGLYAQFCRFGSSVQSEQAPE